MEDQIDEDRYLKMGESPVMKKGFYRDGTTHKQNKFLAVVSVGMILLLYHIAFFSSINLTIFLRKDLYVLLVPLSIFYFIVAFISLENILNNHKKK